MGADIFFNSKISNYTFNLYVFSSFIILGLLILTLLLTCLINYKGNNQYFANLSANKLKFYINIIIVFTLLLLTWKFLCGLFISQEWLLFEIKRQSTEGALLSNPYIYNNLSNNVLGDALLLLCYISSFITIWYLGDKGVFNEHSSSAYFLFFLICTSVMIHTTNLLVMFISFEFIFLPSMYFVYQFSYAKKADKSIYYLLLWTLFGAFLILYGFAYLYYITNTLDYKALFFMQLTPSEITYIYCFFFIGFGIKIPIFPFHFWLTKVHVEAPAGFSMFLSGFLVKTALYCFYYIHLSFSSFTPQIFFIIWVSLGIIEASVKLWSQQDIKKLIAFATIQEMNLIFLVLLLTQSLNVRLVSVFLLVHGLLSVLMFFLVDQIQKRTGTRNISDLSGTLYKYPVLRIAIWLMIFQFIALPLTIKFVIEWYIGGLLFGLFGVWGLIIYFITIFFGSLGFLRCWLLILYGVPQDIDNEIPDLTQKELWIVFFLIILLTLLNLLLFLI